MNRSGSSGKNFTRRVIGPLGLCLCLVGLQLPGCSGESPTLAPLPPSPSPGNVVAGTVRAEEGQPIANAVVTLEEVREGITARVRASLASQEPSLAVQDKALSLKTQLDEEILATVSDSRGRFFFNDVDPGRYTVSAAAGSHLAASQMFSVPLPEETASSDTTLVEIYLTPVGTFLGNVSLENESGFGGSIVYVEGTSYVAITDVMGDYSLTGVPVGTWSVKAMHHGFLNQATEGTIAAAGDSTTLPPLHLLLNPNIPPTALADPVGQVLAGTPIQLSGSGQDPDGFIVLYEWDFEDDGSFDHADSNSADVMHIYESPGTYRAKLRVTDDKGARGLAVVEIEVLSTIPDLVVTRLIMDPPAPEFGEAIRVIALVKNQGTGAASSSSTSIALNDIPGCLLPTPALAVGDSAWVDWCEFSPPEPGVNQFKACADADATVPESDEDNNCLSVEVTISGGIFVSSFSGSPVGDGTLQDPVNSITSGIALAQSQGGPVRVAAGDYPESITLVTGVDIIGGYDDSSWEWDPWQYHTVIRGGTIAMSGQSTSDVELIGLEIISADAAEPGTSSFGLFLWNCQQIFVQSCSITAGNGGPGSDGLSGAGGSRGGDGQIGQPGCENSTSPLCDECPQPLPGPGGYSPWGTGGGQGGAPGVGDYRGDDGQDGLGVSTVGGLGGSGGSGGGGGDGWPGSDGPDGAHGPYGAGGVSFGFADISGYVPSNGGDGANGEHGSGGGGGGGGGGGDDACDSYGSSGGGGGGGGERGMGGTGGHGGGGSFATWIQGTSIVAFENCEFVTGNGGTGGFGNTGGGGGYGGLEGAGGPYGGVNEQDDGGMGGPGGQGGDGGNGGHGGGGGGGPSVGILRGLAATVTYEPSIFTLGPGGLGGSSAGNIGQNGVSTEVLDQ